MDCSRSKKKDITDLDKPITIIVLNWNGAKDTARCIHYLKKLEYNNFNLLLIDNHSNDNSIEFIKEQYPEIEIINNKSNYGFAGGCNVGIRAAIEARSKYIWLINNDAITHEKSLSYLLNKMREDESIGAVGSVIYEMDKPTEIQAWGGGYINLFTGKSKHCKKGTEKLSYITGASIFLRVAALKDIGLFDERFFVYWEDADLSFRLTAKSWKICVQPKAKIWHKESSSTGRFSKRRAVLFYSARAIFLIKHSKTPFFSIFYGLIDQTIRDLYKSRWPNILGSWEGTVYTLYEKYRTKPKTKKT